MGMGMDELEEGYGADEEVLEWERDKAFELGCIVVGHDHIDPMVVEMNRLVGLRRKYEKLMFYGEGDEYQVERYAVYYEMLDDAFNKRQRSGEINSRVDNVRSKAIELYEQAKCAPIKSTIACPSCNKIFTKKHPLQAFCSNGRKRKQGNCKDNYWNMVNPSRNKYRGETI